MLVQMDARPGRTQAHMLLGMPVEALLPAWWGNKVGRGGTNTWREVGPRISGNSGEAMKPKR